MIPDYISGYFYFLELLFIIMYISSLARDLIVQLERNINTNTNTNTWGLGPGADTKNLWIS